MSTKKEPDKKSSLLKAISLTSLGWEMAIPIFVGVLLGSRLDRWFNTNYTFTIILLVLGIMIAYYSLYRHIELEMLRTKAAKQKKQEEENKHNDHS